MIERTETTKDVPPQDTLFSTIGRIAGVITSKEFPAGYRSALRRLTPGSSPSLGFYRFAFHYLPQYWENQKDSWVALVAGIALMHPFSYHPDLSVGRALAEADYSEARLERILASESETFIALLLRTARFLRAKEKPMNWIDFAILALTNDISKREQARMRIARDYFRHISTKE